MEITGKKQKLRKNAFILFFLLPTLVCFCVFYLYPIATVVISSFAKWDYTNLNDMQMYSFGHLFDNYKYIFEKYPYFWEGLRNSCIWALCGLVVQVPIATGVALVISKKCRGWKLARNIYVIPNIISSAAMGLIFLQLYNPKYGIINEIIRVFVPNFQDNVLFIVLPLIKDTIKTISILSVSAGFLLYNEVYFLTNGAAGTKSISFLIRELAVVSPRAQYARANAIGAIQILGGLVLILIINMLFRERKQKGGRR